MPTPPDDAKVEQLVTYSLTNPAPYSPELRTFAALNQPDPAALQKLCSALRSGSLELQDLWLLTNAAGTAYAAVQLRPYPNQPTWRLGVLRTQPELANDAATALFRDILELSEQGDPIHLIYNDRGARDFGALPDRLGWRGGDDPSISYRTDLSQRSDLTPDPAAVPYDLAFLHSDAFRQFYEPVRRRQPSDTRTFETLVQDISTMAERQRGKLYGLEEHARPVAMGLVTNLELGAEHAAGVNVLGVALAKRRQGWGARLHRHLMWAARQRSPLYLGGTNASNVAMRRLFETNGCAEDGRTWELEPASP